MQSMKNYCQLFDTMNLKRFEINHSSDEGNVLYTFLSSIAVDVSLLSIACQSSLSWFLFSFFHIIKEDVIEKKR